MNPASGTNREAQAQVEAFLAQRPDLDAEICLTHAFGDARRYASEAAAAGYDVVAAYGGDGTMMEAADGLRNTDVPLALLPGGTANVMAIELGVPQALDHALALMADPERKTRQIDMGSIDGEYFLLRAGIGYEAEISAPTARAEKSKAGRLAYFRNALRKLRNIRQTRYIVTVDGEVHVVRGITCMICNSSNIGLPNLRLVNSSDVSDGLLDIIIVASMKPGSILRVLLSIVLAVPPNQLIAHWQGKRVTVETKHRQLVARDGEILKRAKRVSAVVVPAAVRVVVPPNAMGAQ